MSSLFDWLFHGRSNSTTTVSPTLLNKTVANESPGNEGATEGVTFLEAEAGAIAGLVFGILFSVAIFVVAYIMYRRHKRRNEEYEREVKTYKMSRNNAGVYMDTTVTGDGDTLITGQWPAKQKSVYASLRQNPDLYEADSDDEI